MGHTKLSIYISMLLRHKPEALALTMDRHGWVPVEQLLERINSGSRYTVTREILEEIVRTDGKGRFRISDDGAEIKACQGHSIPWVEPELQYAPPPRYLYHGTTAEAWEKIRSSGCIHRMKRHGVHMLADPERAWQSARRWKKVPVVLKIDAAAMHAAGAVFGVSDNGVWCTEQVPAEYVVCVMQDRS